MLHRLDHDLLCRSTFGPTASAICRISSRFAEMPVLMLLPLRPPPQRVFVRQPRQIRPPHRFARFKSFDRACRSARDAHPTAQKISVGFALFGGERDLIAVDRLRSRPSNGAGLFTGTAVSSFASKPTKRSKSSIRISGRSMPGELISVSRTSPSTGSSRSNTGPSARESRPQSSMPICPSLTRSAMI